MAATAAALIFREDGRACERTPHGVGEGRERGERNGDVELVRHAEGRDGLGVPFAERGRLSDDYIRAIKAAFGGGGRGIRVITDLVPGVVLDSEQEQLRAIITGRPEA